MNVHDLGFFGQLLFIALGVAASVLIPVLMAAGPKASGRSFGERWWQALLAGYVSDSTLQKFKQG